MTFACVSYTNINRFFEVRRSGSENIVTYMSVRADAFSEARHGELENVCENINVSRRIFQVNTLLIGTPAARIPVYSRL